MDRVVLEEEAFGELIPFLRDEEITDINYNGAQLWVDHLQKGRYVIRGAVLSDRFLSRLAARLADAMNRSFNPYEPLLEAECGDLRISVLHESVTETGKSLSIRKAPAVRRLNREKMLREDYCDEDADRFLENAVKAGLSVVAAGLPGAGKTELVKRLTEFIPPWEKTITIEDNPEIHYRRINPGKDCVEIKVGPFFGYGQAIRAAVRQLPRWILLSEARSQEAEYLLESMSTGTHCLTTIHADDVRKIPDRICNMIRKDVANDVYSFLDVGVLVQAETLGEGKIRRRIAQIGIFYREDGVNRDRLLFESGRWLDRRLPEDLLRRLRAAGIRQPFGREIPAEEDEHS